MIEQSHLFSSRVRENIHTSESAIYSITSQPMAKLQHRVQALKARIHVASIVEFNYKPVVSPSIVAPCYFSGKSSMNKGQSLHTSRISSFVPMSMRHRPFFNLSCFMFASFFNKPLVIMIIKRSGCMPVDQRAGT